MSEPVLGEAGNASSEPVASGRDGEEKPAMDDQQRDWSPIGRERSHEASASGRPDSNGAVDGPGADGAVAPDAAVTKVSRRRRRGSRGGRGRRTGISVVGPPDEEDRDEPVEAVPVVAEVLPAPPPPKPKIGDTRPGSPPVTKRRVRKDLVAGTEVTLAGRARAGERADEVATGSADTTGPRDRRPRRRKGEPGEGDELDNGPTNGPAARPPRAGPRPHRGRPTLPVAPASRAAVVGPAARGARAQRPRTRRPRSQRPRSQRPRPGRPRPGRPSRLARRRTGRRRARLAGEARNGVTGLWGATSWSSTSALRLRRYAVLEGRTLIEHYVSRAR